MKILIDTIESIYKSSEARLKDPLIGSFIVSWCLCNWYKLGLLFFGSDSFEKRLSSFKELLTLGIKSESILDNYEVFLLPLLLAILYVFVIPWIGVFINFLLHWSRDAQIKQKNEYEERAYSNLISLNKAKLRSDPDKKFLEQELELEIKEKEAKTKEAEERAEQARLEAEKEKAKAEENIAKKEKARLEAEEAQANKAKAETEADMAKTKSDIVKKQEEERLKVLAQKQQATKSSLKLPIVYRLQTEFDEVLRKYEVKLSVEGLSKCIAVIFGYPNIEILLNDPQFNNQNLDDVSYLLKDHNKLLNEFSKILDNEENVPSDFHAETALELIGEVFEKWDFDWLDDEGIAETASQRIEEDRYDLLSGDLLSNYMADTDTVFDDLYLELESYEWDESAGLLKIILSGQASGDHRREAGVPGQSIHFQLIGTCQKKIGKYGLSEYSIESTTGGPDF